MQASPARYQHKRLCLLLVGLTALAYCWGASVTTARVSASSLRRSAIVRAVEQARPSVVSINGQKTIRSNEPEDAEDATRRVNGMGTGVIIDPRGYVITNYHVVEGVRQINVTLSDGRTYVAKLVAHDPDTDLAIVRIPITDELPLARIGTSTDLMQGEQVVAIGNAYGYDDTVTCGFISALHRTVQVSDSQKYYDLIQTDASINPGNSGGPLLNIDGEMIGINVAVRVGAQGIGFAIPIDLAMAVAGELMSVERLGGVWHGVLGQPQYAAEGAKFVIKSVREGSPAERAGLGAGDVVRAIGSQNVQRQLDVERALLSARHGDEVSLSVQRGQLSLTIRLVVETAPRDPVASTLSDRYWRTLGVKLMPVATSQLRELGASYNGGLQVTALRPDGPAARQGMRKGDVLVGMHKWETVSLDNVNYILNRPDLHKSGRVKFFVLRGSETLYGHLPLPTE